MPCCVRRYRAAAEGWRWQMETTRMRTVAAIALLCLAGCANPAKDVLTYTRQLKPGMTATQVRELFPKEMHWIDEAADESRQNCWMDRRYSTNRVAHRLSFCEPDSGWRVTTVYFDTNSVLIGLEMGASSGPELAEDELRFPEELIQCRRGPLHWHKTESEARDCQQSPGAYSRKAADGLPVNAQE
jgi:hypothetical protein